MSMSGLMELSGILSCIMGLVVALPAQAQGIDANNKEKFMRLYVGTSSGHRDSGIYALHLNLADGSLSEPKLAAATMNPSFIVLSNKADRLFTCNETAQFHNLATGAVSAYAIDPAGEGLRLIGQQSSAGAGPAHLSIDQDERCLLVANYGQGSVASIGLDPVTGMPGDVLSAIQHTGHGPTKRQTAPHAHAVLADPSNRFALVADLGIDKLMVYSLDHGKLLPKPENDFVTKPGAGPRNFVFSGDGKFVYLVNELDSTLVVLAWDAEAGKLTEVQNLSSLPADFKGPNTSATVQLHPAGAFVYVSNRGADSIAVFGIDAQTRKVTLIDQTPTGKTPRHFTIEPCGRWLICANQDADSVTVYAIDANSGKLSRGPGSASIGRPTCVQVVPQKD